MAMDVGHEPKGGKGKRKKKINPTINVTPLVDIVLVLLIVFMIITPLMAKQMSVNVPAKPENDIQEPVDGNQDQVILRVDASGQAFVNLDAVDDGALPSKLRRVFAARADQTLFFDAADDLAYGRALEVIDIARGAGIVTIAVLTEGLQE